jgi:hypothetical protein
MRAKVHYAAQALLYIAGPNLSAPATQLRILSVSNRVPSLRISGAPGTYELQAPSNLANWFPLATVSTTTNTVNVYMANS